MWAWNPRTGRWQTLAADRPDQAYSVVDSWLVDAGRTRGLDRHRARFADSVPATGAFGEVDIERFLDAAVAALPRAGRWFPRVELTAGEAPSLRLRLRPAPAPLEEVVVYATPFVDRRSAPWIKGPDLVRQAALRAQVEAYEAGEALLAAPDGTVTEGVWTTPLWWDGDQLCAVPRTAQALPSVTRELLLGLARAEGVDLGREAPSVARLRDCETWMVSALHGIRVVSGWLLTPGAAPEPGVVVPGRAADWQQRLQALAVPL